MVRINPFPRGLDDLKYIVSNNVHAILIPKCEDGAHVRRIEDETEKIRSSEDIKEPVYYMPIIESAMGVEKAFEIATSSDNLIALALGLEDYTADIGAERTLEAKESFYARTRVVNACKAAQIQAIESVFSDVADKEGLRTTLKESKSLGFDGMGCIHPDQIDIIHESFTPGKEEIEQAIKIVNAYDEAQKKGRGVSSHENKMIDLPVVKRAKKIIELAEYLGLVGVKRRE
jgi:citrate lyase subunit beta/citryl-CoA lyase